MENKCPDLGGKNAHCRRGFRSSWIPLEHIYQRSNLGRWYIHCMPYGLAAAVVVTTAVLAVLLVVVTKAVLNV
jgi:ABC-type multidrug transport system permease subunit